MKVMAPALTFALSLLGCSTAMLPLQPPGTADEAAIRRLEERERVAVLYRDTEPLLQLWSEQLVVNAPSNQISADRAAVLSLIRQGLIHYSAFERRIERLRIDGDIAIVMGGETIQPTGNAQQTSPTVQRRFTHVWKKEAGVWRLVARHANTVARP